MRTLKKKGGGGEEQWGALIRADMGKPQRTAPCIACLQREPGGQETPGTLLLSQRHLLFFVNSGQEKNDVITKIAYANVAHYGIVEGRLVVHCSAKGTPSVSFGPDADQQGDADNFARMMLIYLDICMLRSLERESKAGQDDKDKAGVDLHKDLSAADLIDTETLICDKRASRFAKGVSTDARTISGERFPVVWKIRLRGLKQALSVTNLELQMPCILVTGSMGLNLMMPCEKVLLPVFYFEMPSFGARKRVFSIHHKIRKGDSQPQLFVFESAHVDGSVIEKSMQQMMQERGSEPFPRVYPPLKNFSASHLAVPLTAEEKTEIEQQTKTLAQKRFALIKGKSKVLAPEAKKEHFTMRFMSNALKHGAADGDDEGDDSDDMDNADYLDMLDSGQI